MHHRRPVLSLLLSSVLFLSILAGCGGSQATPKPTATTASQPTAVAATAKAPQPTAAAKKPTQPAAGIQVLRATFAHGLDEEMRPKDPGANFHPDETVYLSLEIKGRPKKGIVTARFYWHDQFIAKADVDLSSVNSGVLFSVGENTYAGYTLTHKKSLPISNSYHATVLYNDQHLGDYPFHVVPSAKAIATKVGAVTLARGADANYNPVNPTTTFHSTDAVYLVGRGDWGLGTWLQAEWYVNGKLDKTGTRSLTLKENAPDTGFDFSYLPKGGWPVGEHYVVLIVNDKEVGRYTFTVK